MARGGIEPPTYRFSGGRSYQLSYLAALPARAHRISVEAYRSEGAGYCTTASTWSYRSQTSSTIAGWSARGAAIGRAANVDARV